MSDTAEIWIKKTAKARGVIACSIRRADRSLVVRSCRADFSEAEAELAMRKIYEAIHALQENQLPTEHVRWSFENTELYCSAAPVGTMAALLVAKELANAAEIERLLIEAFSDNHT